MILTDDDQKQPLLVDVDDSGTSSSPGPSSATTPISSHTLTALSPLTAGPSKPGFASLSSGLGTPLEPPPSFAESAGDKALNAELAGTDGFFVPSGGEEPPPQFTPYDAEYSWGWNGEIVSHDKHLNEDGMYCIWDAAECND